LDDAATPEPEAHGALAPPRFAHAHSSELAPALTGGQRRAIRARAGRPLDRPTLAEVADLSAASGSTEPPAGAATPVLYPAIATLYPAPAMPERRPRRRRLPGAFSRAPGDD
jgi:hypothetical protein